MKRIYHDLLFWKVSKVMSKNNNSNILNVKIKAPTLEDVARVSGLSPITVSRALNNPQKVKKQTIEKVKNAVELTGYIPNMLAGGLVSKRSKLIAAAVPQINNTMFADTMQAISDQLSQRGYHMLLCLTSYSKKMEEEFVSAVLSRRPDGIVLTGINHSPSLKKKLLIANIPIIETWDFTPTPLDMLVGFSHEKIGEHIGDFLLNKGYKQFAMIWGDDERAALRLRGIMHSLSKRNINDISTHLIPMPATYESGRKGLQYLLSLNKKFDAIICSSDVLAQGAISEATKRKIIIPQELAIMGFGDLNFAKQNSPAISTVFIDKVYIGKLAADMLVDSIEGKTIANKIIDVGFKIIERETT